MEYASTGTYLQKNNSKMCYEITSQNSNKK